MSFGSIYRKATAEHRSAYLLRQAGSAGYEAFQRLRRELSPSARRERERLRQQRASIETLLDRVGRETAARFEGTVLVDAMWDNPNHWLRYTLFRAALGLAHGAEVGVTGAYNAPECRATMQNLGIGRIFSFQDLPVDRADTRRRAKRLLAESATADDILEWNLPHGMPPDIVYDGILKRQRGASVELHHPAIEDHVVEALETIERAEQVLDRAKPDLVALSHSVNFNFGALAWLTIKWGIPGAVLYGEYGLPRFWKLRRPDDVYMTANFLTPHKLNALTDKQRSALKKTGTDYLEKRSAAQTRDVGAIHAFQRDVTGTSRENMCDLFSWDSAKPINAVYAVSWFDNPHIYGMMDFRDSLDWMLTTINVALEADHVNWLFRAHPLETRYGGIRLRDLMPQELPGHVGLAPAGWNGIDVMNSVDTLVTFFGTAGIEFAGMGKPVLTASRGWYHDLQFTKTPSSRKGYEDLLRKAWWQDLDNDCTRDLAYLFAGWHFCCPDWQRGFLMGDDFEQEKLFSRSLDLITRHSNELGQEIGIIRQWWGSSQSGYHDFKMLLAQDYCVGGG